MMTRDENIRTPRYLWRLFHVSALVPPIPRRVHSANLPTPSLSQMLFRIYLEKCLLLCLYVCAHG